MRAAVQKLEGAGYEVTVARKYQEALNLVKKSEFDIAIVDLRWDGDESLDRRASDKAGWKICEAINEADKACNRRTMQLVYSSRFDKEPEIAADAARYNKLPVYKSYNDAGSASLMAAVKFVENLINQPTEAQQIVSKLQGIRVQYLETPLKQQQRFFLLTLLFLAVSLAIVITGGGIAILLTDKAAVGISSSVAGILITSVAGSLLRWLNKREKDLKNTLKELKDQLKSAIK